MFSSDFAKTLLSGFILGAAAVLAAQAASPVVKRKIASVKRAVAGAHQPKE